MLNHFKTYWTREFTDYETVNCLSAKEAGFGANAAIQVAQNTMSDLEEAMDNLVYAATTSNSVLETLTETNKKLTEQLEEAHSLIKKLQDENATLLRIIEASIIGKTPTTTTPPRKNCKRGKIDYKKMDHLMEPEEAGTSAGSHKGKYNEW
eukprot:5343257-Ditylum_brightwellii.AAC.1